jgi:hypothetical protein
MDLLDFMPLSRYLEAFLLINAYSFYTVCGGSEEQGLKSRELGYNI